LLRQKQEFNEEDEEGEEEVFKKKTMKNKNKRFTSLRYG
jgi:hypothetical protein